MNRVVIQEYPNFFDLVLVDSGSTDDTVKIAEHYVDKIINVPIRGKLTARNIGIDQAIGNLIVSADADCYFGPFYFGYGFTQDTPQKRYPCNACCASRQC